MSKFRTRWADDASFRCSAEMGHPDPRLRLQDPDLTVEDSLPALDVGGSASSSADAKTSALFEAAAAAQINDVDCSTSGTLLGELRRWGLLVAEVQRRQESGTAPANGSAGYGELRLEACASSARRYPDLLRSDPGMLVSRLQSAVTHHLELEWNGYGEETPGDGLGRQALLRGLLDRPLRTMPATEGQRTALRSALFGPAPGLRFLEKLRATVEPALPMCERSATGGQLNANAVAGLTEEDSLWDSTPSSRLVNNLQQLLEGPAISASLSDPAMLDAFLSSASRLRHVLARRKPGFGPNRPDGCELDENALRPYLEAAKKALELTSNSQQATICLDVALLAAIHSGELRPCLEWLNFLTSGELGNNVHLGPLMGSRLLGLAASMCPLEFMVIQHRGSCRAFVSTTIPAAGHLGLALRTDVPKAGIALKVVKVAEDDAGQWEADTEDTGNREQKTNFHGNAQDLTCRFCSKAFTSRNALFRHLRQQHARELDVQTETDTSKTQDTDSILSRHSPIATLQVSNGRALLEPGGLEVQAIGHSVLAEICFDFHSSESHVFVNGKLAGKFVLPLEDIAIILCYEPEVAKEEVADLQRWPVVLPLPESQHLANLLAPREAAQAAGSPDVLAAVVASHLRTMNLWYVHDRGEDAYRELQAVEVRESDAQPWVLATVVARGSRKNPIKVKVRPEDTARSWPFVRPWRPRICPGAGDTDRLVHVAHACLERLLRSGDGSSAAPVTYHVSRLLRISLNAESPSVPAHVLNLVSRILGWSREDISDGVRSLLASSALRLLAAVCPALTTQAAQDVANLLEATIAGAPALPAELWLLRSRLLQSCPLTALVSQLHQGGQWPALLRKLGHAVVKPGALSLCALLIRTSLTNAVAAAATMEASANAATDMDVHGLIAFLDHTAAAIMSGAVTAKEPGIRRDLPCCFLLASELPSLAPKAAARAVALVGAVSKAGAPPEIMLSLVQTTCQLCAKLVPEPEAAAPPPEVLRSLRCLPETARESQVEISGESLLREWLSNGSTSAMPSDPDADVAKLAAEVPGVLGARTRAVEVAVLRLLRCAAAGAEQPDLAASREAEQVRAAARRFLSEQQATATGERERVVAEMGEISVWLTAHWVAQHRDLLQGGPVKLMRAKSSVVGSPNLQRSISSSQPLSSKRTPLGRSNSNLMRTNSNLSDTNSNKENCGSLPLRRFVKSKSLELDFAHPRTDNDFLDTVLRLRRAAGGAEASSGSSALIELLFAPGGGRGVAKLHEAVAVAQKRWLRWIQAAALLEQMLEAFTPGERQRPAHTADLVDEARGTAATANSPNTKARCREALAPMARLQICETLAVLFSAWGSPAWFEEMPKPVTQALLGRARRVLGMVLSKEPPQTLAAFGELPLVAAAAVLGVPTPSPRALLGLACGERAESCSDVVSTYLREAAWAAYLAAALLGPRLEAVSQVQAAIRSLCDALSGGKDATQVETSEFFKDANLSNALPSLATGKRPGSPDLALAELLVLLRRLLDAAPAGSPPVLLDVPDQLLQRPPLRALTLTVLASAVRGGASPPSHIGVALVPLSSNSAWEQLAAEQLVRIWQELLIRASSSKENREDLSSWRGSAAALVARLEWRRPELALAALAVLGCRCESSSIRAGSESGRMPQQADRWQPPPGLEWVDPLDDEPPETIRDLLPEERVALFGACLRLLQDIGKSVRPINDAGMPTKPLLGPGLLSLGLRCGRISCKYASPCSSCVAATQSAGIESTMMPLILKGVPLNCTFDPESVGWETDGTSASLLGASSLLASRESADSGVLQWTVRFDTEDLPMEIGVIPHDKAFIRDYVWSDMCAARSYGAESTGKSLHFDFNGAVVQVRCDLENKTVSWRKGASLEGLVEIHTSKLPPECQQKVRLYISCAPKFEAGLPRICLVSNPGYDRPDVCCKQGHALIPLGTTIDNGWMCDGSNNAEGCKKGLRFSGGLTRGMSRFRCHICDFDYCDDCYNAAVQEIVQKHPLGSINATASSASSSGDLLSSKKLLLSENLWRHAAGVATWLLRDLSQTGQSDDVKRLCSETATEWLSIAASAALAEATDGQAKSMSDSAPFSFSGGVVSATDLRKLCGLPIQPPSNNTWASWRDAMSEAVNSCVPVSKSYRSRTTQGPICRNCKMACPDISGAADDGFYCSSCGCKGVQVRCSTCVGVGICKDCRSCPIWNWTDGKHLFTTKVAAANVDMREIGLTSRMPPPLLTEVAVQCPTEFSSALATGVAWPLLRHAIKHDSAARARDGSPWAELVVGAVSGPALEAECLSDLLGALLAAARPVEWPEGSDLGPDLRSARWLLDVMLQKQSLWPSGRVLLAVVKTLQYVEPATFDEKYGGTDTRLGLCRALARAPLGALAATEADIIVEEALELLDMLADEGTPAGALCLSEVTAALLALISCGGQVSAFAKPRPVAILSALAFCRARRTLRDDEDEAAGQKIDLREPSLPHPLLHRLLHLPCPEEKLELHLPANSPVLIQVPTATDFEVVCSADSSGADLQHCRLATVATAAQDRGNAVLSEIELTPELQSLGKYKERGIILGAILPSTSVPASVSDMKADNTATPALSAGPGSSIIKRDAFGRPLPGEQVPPPSIFAPPPQQSNSVTVLDDKSFEESRWEHYQESQAAGVEESKPTLPIQDELDLRWASVSEAVPDGWRIATRSDVGRFPVTAAAAVTADGVHKMPCRLQSPWVLDSAAAPPATLAWRRADEEGDEWDLLEGQLLAKLAAFNSSCFPAAEATSSEQSTITSEVSPSSVSPSTSSPTDEHRIFIDVPVRSGLSTVMASSKRQLPGGVPEVALGTMQEAPAAVQNRLATDKPQSRAGSDAKAETSKAREELGEMKVLNGDLWFTGSTSENIFCASSAASTAGFPTCQLRSGRWFYEVEVLEGCEHYNERSVHVGWMSSAAPSSAQLCAPVLQNATSWAIGFPARGQSLTPNVVCKEEASQLNASGNAFLGVAVDMATKHMWFAVNGKWATAPDFSSVDVKAKGENVLSAWEVQTDAGWRAFRPGKFFSGRAGEEVRYSRGEHEYRAVFTSETAGTQRNLRTGVVRNLRRTSHNSSSSDPELSVFPAVSGTARCTFHTSASTIKYPPPTEKGFRPLEEWRSQQAASKTAGRCHRNESPALPFRFEVEVTELPEEGGAAAVGVAWGTWSAAEATPSPAPNLFGGSSPGMIAFGPANSIFGGSSTSSGGGLFGTPQPASPPTSSGGLFGTPPLATSPASPPASGGSLFGVAQPSSGVGLFGVPQPTSGGSLFGAPQLASGASLFTASQPASSGSLFFASSSASFLPHSGSPPTNATGSLFGATGPSSSSLFGEASTGGFFGAPPPHQQTQLASLFGSSPASASGASTSGGLFGSATPATQAASGASSSGGIFGSVTAMPAAASSASSSGGLFGSMPAAASSGGLFGASAAGTPAAGGESTCTAGGLFGASTSTFGSNIFGAAAASTSSSSSSIFGAASTSSPNIFGAASTSSSNIFGAASTSSPNIFGAASTSASNIFGATNSTPASQTEESADARWWKPGSISWLWHSDGRLECAGPPWVHKAGICTSNTGHRYAAGDLVAVEFLPSVPALLFCRNGAPVFALHMLEGYGGEVARGQELQLLRDNSPDVALPVPGLFAGAQPAVRLPKGGTVSLGHFSIDGQDVSEAKWSQKHMDPSQRAVRLPAFAAASELEGILAPPESLAPPACVESCGCGVRVQQLLSWAAGAGQRVKLVVRSTPRDPAFLDKVLAAWVASQRGQTTDKKQEEDQEVQEMVEVVEPHRFYSKHCMVCTECLSCTGYGNKCIQHQLPDRKGGTPCGCGLADVDHNSGCEVCGRCQSCAAKSSCKPRQRRRDANASTEPSDPVQQAVATIQSCMEASAEVAITAVAPLFDEPVLSASFTEERLRWRGLETMLPQARRRERWTAALQTAASGAFSNGQAPLNYTARLRRRAANDKDTANRRADVLEGQAAATEPVWEQLATQVVGFSTQALQSNTNPFNVTFIGEEDIMDRSIRRCPRCGRLLQKSDGCDSMACCMYGSDGCRGARCDHGGGCGHRFDWNQTLVLGPFQEALEAFSADFMASDLLTDCPNRRARDGPNQDTRLPHPHPALSMSAPSRWRTLLQGLGRMMGVAVRMQLPLRLALNPLGWSWLHAGGPEGLELRQLTESDQQASLMVRYLRGITSAEELAALGEDVEFAAENVAGELVQLDTPGRTVLSIEDAQDLADCLERLHLVEGLEPLASVAAGLASVLPLGMMRLLLDAPMLEEAVCGATDVNLADLREHTELVAPEEGLAAVEAPKPNSTEPILDWLFQALEGFTPSERRGFVRLISGNRRLPEHGEWRMRVRVDKPEEEGGSALPSARECAMLLTVPPCKGASDLAQRLRVTIASSDAQMVS